MPRYVVQLIPEDSSIADDEIVGSFNTVTAANRWRDDWEAKHPGVSGLVKDLWTLSEAKKLF